ncbi:MAG: D-alanyl-D-alanine carboxypeptidase/D-alanyl-D-alanine-endopeptidase [Bacteroidales bacterium]|nr:D-alanyl-D-alanine carboxypeptidase/D-alanyl-D-alanine-endopeptidase [Bacteroidales bacterium]MCM1148231.1 D-alanyl-D-alanine carboxypeptidase/D-alanyl-D-alanine-endopeptidase [Bacteroidales bacterium]MCM1206938.1 D-alanyl-D-alanine carboxypeptidase/D-alanyl-D-alanine-endopeptidase [Bacillota bacterium]MCM1511192.1 D-alanyl-D-alanine carboxypeptidase/D-alanyl-D-alanine-endopeptidase [Clostridium sp.]
MTKRLLFLTYLLFPLCLMLNGKAQELTDSVPDDTLGTDTMVTDTLTSDSIIPKTVQQRIEDLLDKDFFRKTQVGIMVYDLTADTLVFAHNERQLLRPASTMKLLTAITALDYLDGSYRYATSLKYNNGDLTVAGGMDPRFNTDDMNAFVEAVQKLETDTIYGEIKEDRSFKDSKLLGEGWCWDDRNPVLTPLPWNRKDTFLEKFRQMLADAHIIILPKDSIPKDSLGNMIATPSAEIKPATLVTRHHTLDQILGRMMKESDNLYAETMLYQIAHKFGGRKASAKSAFSVMKQLIRKLGLDPSDYRLADGSGLSLYNYQTAELQVKLLRHAYRDSNIYSHLCPSLPVAGVDGTLKDRMKNTKGRNNVRAKTGTLAGISSLAGYLTAANGNVLCFSIINQGIRRAAPAKAFQDKVCTLLCEY